MMPEQSGMRIAAVVVLYNPTAAHIANIDGYCRSVETVFAIDNSEEPDPAIAAQLSGLTNVEYIANHDNLGIARGLNMGAELALGAGFDLLLTMDQDSEVTAGMIEALLGCLAAVGRGRAGIVSPVHQLEETLVSHQAPWEEVEVTMTSGNLLNLEAYRAAGPFNDDYFIDYVDHEYCLRLRQHGYRIVQANDAVLRHRLGVMTWHRFLHKRIKLGNHPPIRRYYSFRNRFHLHSRYGRDFPSCFRYFYREIAQEVAAVVFLETQAMEKLRMMLRGYLDYHRGVFGRFRERS